MYQDDPNKPSFDRCVERHNLTEDEKQFLIVILDEIERRLGVPFEDHRNHHHVFNELLADDLIEYIRARKRLSTKREQLFDMLRNDLVRIFVKGAAIFVLTAILFGATDAFQALSDLDILKKLF